jgi:NAD(P)-dependent dehydrogenase (short-subunit alcohol dehydrogenase family)
MRTLTDKVALVTGASGGIGRSTAVRLGAQGARVGVHYRSDERVHGKQLPRSRLLAVLDSYSTQILLSHMLRRRCGRHSTATPMWLISL